MTVQLTVFDTPLGLPYQPGSPTSRDAARDFAKKARTIREMVQLYVLARGSHGATYKEIMAAMNLSSGTVCGRLNELRGKPGRDGKPRQAYELVATVRRRNGDAVIVHKRFYGQSEVVV